jgi:hypothetical protein
LCSLILPGLGRIFGPWGLFAALASILASLLESYILS